MHEDVPLIVCGAPGGQSGTVHYDRATLARHTLRVMSPSLCLRIGTISYVGCVCGVRAGHVEMYTNRLQLSAFTSYTVTSDYVNIVLNESFSKEALKGQRALASQRAAGWTGPAAGAAQLW